VLVIFICAALLLSGCEVIKSLFFDEESEESASKPACEQAEACCTELEQASAYNWVGETEGKRNAWPNHCPSWNARSENECGELIDAVAKHKDTLQKEHPVFEIEYCE